MFSGGKNTDYSSINPSPTNFNVTLCYYQNGYTIVNVKYLDCTNYEGKKILVYLGDLVDAISASKKLDPHFFEGGSLVARFAPNKQGHAALQKLIT